MFSSRNLGYLLNDGINYLQKLFNSYFNYKTFYGVYKYVDKGVINGGANSALVLFTVDDYFHAVIKRLPKKIALTVFILWMAGCITLNVADLATDDLEKLSKGDLKVFFASCKLCIRPLLAFLNGFNIVGVPAFLFVEVFNFDELFSDEGYTIFQSVIMAVSFLLGLYDAQKALRTELRNIYNNVTKQNAEFQQESSAKIENCLNTLDKVGNSKYLIIPKLFIEGSRVILINYLNFTALGFYLAFIRKVLNSKLPFQSGSKTTALFILTTTANISQAAHAIAGFFSEKYKKDAQDKYRRLKNLCWKKFIVAASKFLNISYDVFGRFGAVTVIFLVIKHTLEVINNSSYDNTRGSEISEILTMCIAALAMFHEGIDSGRRNYEEYKEENKIMEEGALIDMQAIN